MSADVGTRALDRLNDPLSVLSGHDRVWIKEQLARLAAAETALRAARNWIADGSEDAGHLLGRIDNALAVLATDPAAEEAS